MGNRSYFQHPGQIVHRFLGTAYDTVKIVANNIDEVLAVSTNISAITTLNTQIADVTTIAADLNGTNTIGTVATDLAGTDTIGTVALYIADVNTAATNIVDIQNASGNAATATTQANNASASATEAQNWANLGEDVLVPEGDLVDDYSSLHWAKKSEADRILAQSAATAAQNALDNSIYNDIMYLPTEQASPFTITAAERGKLLLVDTTASAYQINLPDIDTLNAGDNLPFTFGVKKTSNDGNLVTITASGTDSIDGGSSVTLSGLNTSYTIVADDAIPEPDNWEVLYTGSQTGNVTIDTPTFTAGVSNSVTLSVDPGSENNIEVMFDGVVQHHSTYTVSGTTVNFDDVIPAGVLEVEVRSGVTVAIGVPGDNTVSKPKLSVDQQLPSGAIMPFAMATPPTGWLYCNGDPYSTATYPDLFAAIGYTYGGSGGTFNVPDYRGEFLRGWDNGAGNDPDAASRTGGDTVGSTQGDAIRNITGQFRHRSDTVTTAAQGETGAFTGQSSGLSAHDGGSSAGRLVTFNASNVVPTGLDNRPRNIAVNYCIKI